MKSFVLLAHASLAASRTLLQQLLACLNLNLDSKDLFSCYNILLFFELWQQRKQLKSIELSEVWPDIYDESGLEKNVDHRITVSQFCPMEMTLDTKTEGELWEKVKITK